MQDLDALLDPDLHLPIAGKDYRIPCSAQQGLHLHRLITSGAVLSDDEERAEILLMLGDTYEQMVDDGVRWPTIVHAARTAMLWFGHSEAAGAALWERLGAPGNPIPPSPNQARMGERIRTIFRRPERTDRMILAAARTTPPPACASGTASNPRSSNRPGSNAPSPTA